MSAEYFLNKYIASLYRRSKSAVNAHIADLDIRATIGDLMLFVYDNPGQSQKEIAQNMIIDPSLLARDLQQLENRGLLVRQVDANDRRVRRIRLTPAGKTKAVQLQKAMTAWWAHFFDTHPEIDAAAFSQALHQVYETLLDEEV